MNDRDGVLRFRRHGRVRVPEYIAERRKEGRELEPVRHETPRKNPQRAKAKLAEKVFFSRQLRMESTTGSLRAYGLKVAQRIMAARRRKAKAKEKAATA